MVTKIQDTEQASSSSASSSTQTERDAVGVARRRALRVVRQIRARRLARAALNASASPLVTSDDDCAALLRKLRDDQSLVSQRASILLDALAPQIAALGPGSVIVIDLVRGDFVTAGSRLAALDAFDAKFGAGSTMGWLHQVGGGIVLGGGVA
jgi:hypothetical protein